MDTISTPLLTALTPEVIEALCAPFDWSILEVRPGAVRKDGTGALALAYADPRVYQTRLDAVVGPANWSAEFIPWGEHKLICRLTIFGIAKSSTGEGDPRDPNAGTVAEAQAFKRACVAFGLDRYLYDLPHPTTVGPWLRRQQKLPLREPGSDRGRNASQICTGVSTATIYPTPCRPASHT